MNKKSISMVAILLLVVTVGAFASSNSDLKGRDFVRLGTLGIVSGTLSEDGGEWYLTSPTGEYALHLGKYEVIYPKGINLKEGSAAVVRGFVLDSDISAVTVDSANAKYSLRTVAGVPLWSGQGMRENQQAFQTERTGQANFRQPLPVMQSRQASFQGQGMQALQSRQASFQGQGMQALQGRQASFQGQGMQVVQSRQASSQGQGMQALQNRQASFQGQGMQMMHSRPASFQGGPKSRR
ncbi:MAG: hypothetical protein RBR15_05270 [Sphaerochaeta sp.]|nr:hypothetical protein [Sphaerochaeta sp.]